MKPDLWKILLTVFVGAASIPLFLYLPFTIVAIGVTAIVVTGAIISFVRKDVKYGIVLLLFSGLNTFIYFKSTGMLTLSPLLTLDPTEYMRLAGIATAIGKFVEWIIPIIIALLLITVAFCWSLITGVENVYAWARAISYMMLGFMAIVMFFEVTTVGTSTYSAVVTIVSSFTIPFELYYLIEFWSWFFSGYTAAVAVMTHFVATRSGVENME